MRSIFVLIIFLGISNTGAASLDLESTERLIIPVDNVTPRLTQEDVAKVIPTDLVAGSSESTVLSRVVDRGVSLWFNSPVMKQSSFGRFADETQKKLKTDIVMAPQGPEGVSHKFSFRVEAFQALACLEYSGWLNAALNYDAKTSSTDLSFKEKVFANKDLVISHKANRLEDMSMVGLAWSW